MANRIILGRKMMGKFWEMLRSALKGEERDYTTGGINQAITLLAIPMIIEMLGEGLFAVVDAYFLAKVSDAAATTVGLVEVVTTIIYSIAIGISIAATAMVSRRIGENEPEEANKAAFQAILLSLLLGVVLGILGFFFAEDLLRAMKASEEVIQIGTPYARITWGFNFVIILLFVLNGIYRGAGDAVMAMISLWVANLLNIILDPLLIFGIGPFPELGTTGAAIATTIGRSTGVIFQLFILFRGTRLLKLGWQHLQVLPEVMKKMMNVASTGFAQYFIGSASWIFLSRLVAEFGTEVYAGYFYAIRIIIFTILPSWGIANAAATLVGQNLGAGKPDRAEKSVWRAAQFNMYFLILVGVVFFLFAESLIGIFTSTPAAVKAGVLSLQIISVGYIFFGYGMIIGQAFGGAGDTRTPTIVNFICFWLIEIPLAYFLAKQIDWGLHGVLIAIAFCESLLAIILVIWFRKGHWKLVKI